MADAAAIQQALKHLLPSIQDWWMDFESIHHMLQPGGFKSLTLNAVVTAFKGPWNSGHLHWNQTNHATYFLFGDMLETHDFPQKQCKKMG